MKTMPRHVRRFVPPLPLAPLLLLAMLLPGWSSPAAEPARLDRENLLQYRDEAGQVQPVKSAEDWQKRRAEIVRGMQQVMGPLPGDERRVALDVKVEEEADAGSYVRRLITYQSEPGSRTPAYLCIPKDVLEGKRKAPAVLCLHPTDNTVGHQVVVGLGGRAGRGYAAELAERGYVTLSPSYPHLANYWPNLGKLGYVSGTMKAIWDNSRGLDLLQSLPYVDASHGFGAIGHSLGGHNAIYTAVFDPRVTVIVSSCGFDSYLDYYGGAERNWYFGKGWCQIRYMPRMSDYRGKLEQIPFDFHELLGALAPRPVFVNAPLHDSNFVWQSVDRCAAAARPVYKLLDAEGKLTVEHPDCDHNFPDDMRNAAYAVIDLALRGKAAGGPAAGMGILVGEVTDQGALAQVRLSAADRLVQGDLPGLAGVVEFTLRRADAPEGTPVSRQVVEAAAERDFVARAAFGELEPGTRYVCTTRLGQQGQELQAGPTAEFRTLPGRDSADSVRFVVVTGMNHAKFHGDDRIDRARHLVQNNTELPQPYTGPDKHLGYPALKTILSLKPDFFVGTGDNVYYDTPVEGRAETADEMRRKWHQQFVQPRYRDLFAQVPTYWEIDDHDYRVDDCDNTGDYAPSPELGRRIMLEQLPLAPAGAEDAVTYRTHRVNRDLQIWLPENRMHRSPNAMPDGPDKSIWGAEQKAWLKRTLRESDATFKLLISPTPMVGPDDLRKTDNHTNIGGFRHERDEFFAWLKEEGLDKRNFYVVCGDRHWQYHAVDPTGIEEFSCGALVDANSRLGRRPGDPKSTDPEGRIRQPYYQTPRSAGFLLIEVQRAGDDDPARLTFAFHDEQGKLLYKHAKRSN